MRSARSPRFVPSLSYILLGITLAVAAPALGAGPTHVGGTIISNTTWTAANSPYVMDSAVTVNAGVTLTIEPGVVVKAGLPDIRLLVHGTLVAQGTTTDRVAFTSLKDDTLAGDTNGDGSASAPAPGDWGGVGLWTGSSGSLVIRAEVRYAGGTNWWYGAYASVFVSTAAATVDDSTIASGSHEGIFVLGGAGPTITGNTIRDNAGWAIYFEDVDSTRGVFRGNAAFGNGANGIRAQNFLDYSATWEDAIPFVIDGSGVTTRAGTTLTVRPGTVVKASTTDAALVIHGTLVADASGGAPIVFTSLRDDSAGGDTNNDGAATSPAPGDWGGVALWTDSTASLLDNVKVRWAGALNWWYGAYASLFCNTSSATVRNSSIGHGSSSGIDIHGAATPAVAGNTVTDNSGWAIFLEDPDSAANLSGNAATGNGVDGIRVSGTVNASSAWRAGLPYVLDGSGATNAAGTTLTLQAGTIVKGGAGAKLTTSGSLRAEGTDAARVYLTSIKDDTVGGDTNRDGSATSPAPGDWGGVGFLYNSADQSLAWTEVRYAGSENWWYGRFAAVYARSTSASLTSCRITGSSSDGLLVQNGSITMTGSRVEETAGFGVRLMDAALTGSVTGCPHLESVNFEGNNPGVSFTGNVFEDWGALVSGLGLKIVGPFLTENTFHSAPGATVNVWAGTLTRDDTWGPAAGPIVMTGGLTVGGTAGPDLRTTLTLLPGVELRFPASAQLRLGAGGSAPGELIADAAGGPPIRLTSAQAYPAIGAWDGIRADAGCRVALRNAEIAWPSTALLAYGAVGPIEALTVNRGDTGLYFSGSTFEGTLTSYRCINCRIAVRTVNAPAVIRDSELLGSSWGVYNGTSGVVVDARQNWWGSPTGPSGVGPGSGSAVTSGVLYDPWLDAPRDDGDGVPRDDGDGVYDPCTGGQTTGCDDNCTRVTNASQRDVDDDGVGDACDTDPTLVVSSDPADGADFLVIQQAVDAAPESGARIEILPGLGPYHEAVRVDRLQVLTFAGRAPEGGPPVVVDGGGFPAFNLENKVGGAPMRLSDLTLRGNTGVRSLVDGAYDGLTFEFVGVAALDLDGGTHTATRCRVAAGTPVGVDVGPGVQLILARSTIAAPYDAGLLVAGVANVENTLITAGAGGAADGVRLAAGGLVTVSYSTIAGNAGAGVDNAAGGAVTIERSVIHGNAAGDLANVACSSASWSAVGVPDCSAVNENIAADPLLGTDYRLEAGSPCLDHGPGPGGYSGQPPMDLAGGPRLLDFDGDGFAQNDCGAFEHVNPARTPGEVQNVLWESSRHMVWDATPTAVEYHVYRDLLQTLSYAHYGLCRDDLDPVRSDTQFDDAEVPEAGRALFYLFTAEDGAGREGTLGSGTQAERSDYHPCP